MEIIKGYRIEKPIGGGNFGQVFLASSPYGKLCAIKRLQIDPLDKDSLNFIYNEIEILKSAKSASILKIVESFSIKSDVYIVTDYCAGGDLKTLIDEYVTFPFAVIKKWLKQLLIAMQELKQQNIVHRDIKTANLLLTEPNIENADIKICDFGFAKILDEDLTSTYLGTPYYMAPEILNNEDYGYKVDVWSLGVVAYQMLCGTLPFQAKNKQELMQMQLKPITFDEELDVPEDAKRFIRRMLTVDPKNRPSFEDLLEDSFFISSNSASEIEVNNKNNMQESLSKLKDLKASEINANVAKLDKIIEKIDSASIFKCTVDNEDIYLEKCIDRFSFMHFRFMDHFIKKMRTDYIDYPDLINKALENHSKIIEQRLKECQQKALEITEADEANLKLALLKQIENYKFSESSKILLTIGEALFPESNAIRITYQQDIMHT